MVNDYDLDPKEIKKYFTYDYETGDLKWNIVFNEYMRVGKIAGSKNKFGVLVGIKKHIIPLRRVVWAFHHGEWPKGFVKHRDGDPFNTRIENLYVKGKLEKPKKKEGKFEPKSHLEIPLSLVRDCFYLDSRNCPRWKKKVGPKVNIGELAGRRMGDEIHVGFCGLLFPVRFVAVALLTGEWPEK